MAWQFDYAGTNLINKRILVHVDELDEPQHQLRTIIIPPDPDPLYNARPEPYSIDETPVTTRITQGGSVRILQNFPPSIRIISGDAI